jgi:hypothetical protein
MSTESNASWIAFTEEFEVAGHQLLDEINRLIAEGNVRRLQIRSEAGEVYMTVPLTAGVVAGGVVAIATPWLAVIGAVAGLFTKLKLEVLREDGHGAASGRAASGDAPPPANDASSAA